METTTTRQLAQFPEYDIDEDGVVYRRTTDQTIAWSHTQQGAPKVSLKDVDGKRRTMSIKGMVARTFLRPPPENCDTPIQLDGDQDNCHVSNLMWRPRFFANLYARQFANDYPYYHTRGVIDLKTKEEYATIHHAAVANGILRKDILLSVHNDIPVRCTHQQFEFVAQST